MGVSPASWCTDQLLVRVAYSGWGGIQAGCQILGGWGIGRTCCRDVRKASRRSIEVRTGR
ncbi:hypothetical protein TSUD_57310 [Trifolium subterraneum]|uniref:Uncharacterized protein n=1 Tax=Trifolium subterraneum TaxID=3900 RepID=A0A2Z6NFC4_TRISU|nr:hypothetical protein TSUD_57310 [Trifolium subterraneum]